MRRDADYLVGMRILAVADLTTEDLASMFSENEMLFVEHKCPASRFSAHLLVECWRAAAGALADSEASR